VALAGGGQHHGRSCDPGYEGSHAWGGVDDTEITTLGHCLPWGEERGGRGRGRGTGFSIEEFVHRKGKPGKPTMSLRRRPGVGSLLPRRTVLILLVGLCMCTYMAEGGKQKKGRKARGREATGGGGGGSLEGQGTGAGGSTARGKCPLGQGATLQQLIGKGGELFGKDWERSEACYQLALDQAPQSSLAAYNVGLSQMYQHKSDAAIASFNKAISIDPKYGDAYFGLGSALYERAQGHGQGHGQGQGGSKGSGSGHDQASDLKAAENALVKSTKMSPKNHAAYNSLGNVYLATGKMELALSAYRSVSKHSPKSPEGYANAGRVLLGMGRGKEALRAMMDAADLAPANAALQYELAMALKGVGREEEAKRFLRMATRLDQTLAAAHYQLGELQSGTIYTENKDIPGAIRSHTLAIRHDPSMAEAYMSLAMLHWNLGRLFMAEILLKEGLSLKPMGEIAANLGIVQNDLGKKDDAILSLKKSMELSPRLAEAPKCLGDVYKVSLYKVDPLHVHLQRTRPGIQNSKKTKKPTTLNQKPKKLTPARGA
jgi:tetratricopeptide (TPR) repeat protein